MRWWKAIRKRLTSLVLRGRAERELSDELRFHLEREIETKVAAGLAPEDARRAAMREFGGTTQIAEQCRDSRGLRFVEDLRQDLRYAGRSMRQDPTFAVVVVLTLALGIGANTAIFSLFDAVLLSSLPVPDPDELFIVAIQTDTRQSESFSNPLFEDLREAAADHADVFATGTSWVWEVVFPRQNRSSRPETARGTMVSGNYFETLGLAPVLGRLLTPADDQLATEVPAAVISHRYWLRRFDGDPAVVGKSLILHDIVFTIVGVAPREFFGVFPGSAPEIWLPIQMESRIHPGRATLDSYSHNWLRVMGRPKGEVSSEHVRAAMEVRHAQVMQMRAAETSNPVHKAMRLRRTVALEPGGAGFASLRRRYSEPLRLLLAVVGLVLLIACANVANMFLARATARSTETSVRLAIGAGRWRLVRQWMTECGLLTLLGSALGILLAFVGVRALAAVVASGSSPVMLFVSPNIRVLGFTVAIAAVAAALFGAAPAMMVSRTDLRSALSGASRGLTSGRKRLVGRRALAVAQIAMSIVIVVGAGLFLRTIRNLETADFGFSRENLVIAWTSARDSGYALPASTEDSPEPRQSAERRLQVLYRHLLERLEAIPQVRSATLSQCAALMGCTSSRSGIEIDGAKPDADDDSGTRIEHVGPRYLETMGISLLAGRDLTDRDLDSSEPVALVNETFSKHYFGKEDPIGRTFRWNTSKQPTKIVGLVKDVNHDGPRRETPRFIYYPQAQWPTDTATIVVRSKGDPSQVGALMREALREVDPRLSAPIVARLDQQFDNLISQERLAAHLTALFAVLALVVTCVGLYGLMAYLVARRTREIGLRMALGARRSAIVRGVLRETLALLGLGVGLGLAAAVVVTRAADKLLFGIEPNDPMTIAAAALTMAVVVLAAAALPARRAAKVHPMTALRCE